ncbi:hypothetical protein LINPERHAP1_LOCUS41664, partial [Linum perenne]
PPSILPPPLRDPPFESSESILGARYTQSSLQRSRFATAWSFLFTAAVAQSVGRSHLIDSNTRTRILSFKIAESDEEDESDPPD